jgi:hypothetical protein
MALPEPTPGLVISYAYLWHDQRRVGLEEGRKARPCAIVLAKIDDGGDKRIYVAPITHSRPDDPYAVELIPKVKRRLGLNDEPSWIVTNELNWFIWPGFDLRPVARNRLSTFDWGVLPVEIFDAVKRGVAIHQRDRGLKMTLRK